MGHDHSGHDHHHHEVTNINTAFLVGIALNAAFVVIELIIGFSMSSLALISDAGHNAADVFSLLLSLFAFRMLKVKASESYSYGYKKLSILVSLANALFLLGTVAVIFYEGFRRLHTTVPVAGKEVSLIAFIGIFVNGISAMLFFRGQKNDANVKGAYLHLLSDAIVSFGVVIGGMVIFYTHWFWLDTALSFVIGFVILLATNRLLGDSIRLALDGTPRGIDLDKVRSLILNFPGVTDMHHVHVWAISSKENAMTAHLVIEPEQALGFEKTKHRLKHALLHADIHHATFETESQPCAEAPCDEEHMHAD